MPASFADSLLPPTAYTLRPNLVYFINQQKNTSRTSAKIRITGNTPNSLAPPTSDIWDGIFDTHPASGSSGNRPTCSFTIASDTIMDGTRNRTVINAITAEFIIPTQTASRTTTGIGSPIFNVVPVTNPINPRTVPEEISISPSIMTIIRARPPAIR